MLPGQSQHLDFVIQRIEKLARSTAGLKSLNTHHENFLFLGPMMTDIFKNCVWLCGDYQA